MNISIIYISVMFIFVIYNNCSGHRSYAENYRRRHGRLPRHRPRSRTFGRRLGKKAIQKSLAPKELERTLSNTDQVALSNIDRNINMNIKGGGGGGGGGIDPGGNGGNLTTNLFINKIKTIHTSDGTIVKIKPGDGRTLEALKLIIDGGGGGGGGGIGKGGDGGSLFTTLTINKLKTVFRNEANATIVEVQNPLRGLSLNINGGGGGGGGGPGQGGDGGDLVTNIVIGKVKTVTKNGARRRKNKKDRKLKRMLKRKRNNKNKIKPLPNY
ncbi:regulator of gene activity-like [Mytilus trossulus]|uniref:regulator of gene activity-like n=1 Tax=Mytilus trossulus TaxID=6551 RepID=UPI003004EBAE